MNTIELNTGGIIAEAHYNTGNATDITERFGRLVSLAERAHLVDAMASITMDIIAPDHWQHLTTMADGRVLRQHIFLAGGVYWFTIDSGSDQFRLDLTPIRVEIREYMRLLARDFQATMIQITWP